MERRVSVICGVVAQLPTNLYMTISGTALWPPASQVIARAVRPGKDVSFRLDEVLPDTVNLSPAAMVATPGIIGLTDPRILAYQKRVEALNDPTVIVFDKELSDDDKQMLASLNGGNWQQDGPANHLIDQIVTARHDGTLNGPISSGFIQNIVDKQRLNAPFDPADKLDPIPQSVLDGALDWINKRSE